MVKVKTHMKQRRERERGKVRVRVSERGEKGAKIKRQFHLIKKKRTFSFFIK